MSGESFGLSRLGQVFMPARDLERGVAFYRDRLGIPFLFEAPPRMAFFDLDGVRLLLGEAEGEGPGHTGSVLYFSVPDIAAAHESLTERGVDFNHDPHLVADMGEYELWMAFFKDSEENQLALMSERSKG